jgi:hypothetical protein
MTTDIETGEKGLAWLSTIAAARATVQDGGGTFDARTLAPVAPTEGYAVGLGDGSKVLANSTAADIAVVIYRAVQANKSAPYVGTWIDDAVIYIDPVVILQSLQDALTLARALGEKAIYSFATGESVTL